MQQSWSCYFCGSSPRTICTSPVEHSVVQISYEPSNIIDLGLRKISNPISLLCLRTRPGSWLPCAVAENQIGGFVTCSQLDVGLVDQLPPIPPPPYFCQGFFCLLIWTLYSSPTLFSCSWCYPSPPCRLQRCHQHRP